MIPSVSHPVLFLTDRGEWHQAQAQQAAPAELTVTILRRPSADELSHWLPTTQFIISERSEAVTGEMIGAAPNLRHIVRLGSLTVGIDLAAARAAHIRVSLQPIAGTIYVAEHLLMMTLAVLKRLGRSLWQADMADHGLPARQTDEDTFAFNWLDLTDIDGLYDKTVAIGGMGEIGVELARRLQPFHLKALLYNKRSRYPAATERALGLTYADLDTCLTSANVFISLFPFVPGTEMLLNVDALAKLPRGAALIHAGSGGIIDEQAVIAAVRSGQLSGAAFDTYEYEPLQPDSPLVVYARDPRSNLLLTPHTAAASVNEPRSNDYAEILRTLYNEPLRYAVDLEHLEL